MISESTGVSHFKNRSRGFDTSPKEANNNSYEAYIFYRTNEVPQIEAIRSKRSSQLVSKKRGVPPI